MRLLSSFEGCLKPYPNPSDQRMLAFPSIEEEGRCQVDDTIANKVMVMELIRKDWTSFEYNYYFSRYDVDTLIEMFGLDVGRF